MDDHKLTADDVLNALRDEALWADLYAKIDQVQDIVDQIRATGDDIMEAFADDEPTITPEDTLRDAGER